MIRLINNGKLNVVTSVGHSTAATEQAIRLYGINKWASENNIDITLHVHFNDNPRYNGLPKYSGFTIYVPEKQYSNSTSSVELAEDLMRGLSTVSSTSTLEQESTGVVPDQDLIAIGRYNTADSLAVLIEYAYIYEQKLSTKSLRKEFYAKMAKVTAEALTNFFESRTVLSS